MKNQSALGKLVEQYLFDYEEWLRNQDIGKRGLARIIVNENPQWFDMENTEKEIERVRNYLRQYTGTGGGKTTKPRTIIDHGMPTSELVKSGLSLPKSEAKTLPEYVIPGSKVFLLSDVHFPYHNERALETAVNYAVGKDVDCVVINGDLLDFFKISKWAGNPTMPSLADEIQMAREFFEWLRVIFPEPIPIIYKLGNHEERWEHYLYQKAGEFVALLEEGSNITGLDKFLHLDRFGVIPIQGRQKMALGKLKVVHGHEFGRSVFSPVNPARGLFNRAKYSAVIGHHHQSSSHSEGTLDGSQIVCYSIGCLCHLSPDYMPFGELKWNHGFAIVEVNQESGEFDFSNYKILKSGKVTHA